MRIKTGFYLSLVAGGALVAAAVFFLGYSQFRMAAAVAQSQVWDRISTKGMELVQLTNEVLLYGEPRAVEQWQAQFVQVDRLCQEAGAFGAGPTPALLRRVTINLADMPPLFASLTRVRGGGPGDDGRVLLSSQLFQKTTVLQAALRDLKAASDADLSIAHGSSKERVFITFAVFAGLTSVFGVVLSVRFRKAVLKPLQDLERTIGRINAGEAARRVEYLAEDEIGVVGRAFNRLLDRQEEDRLEIEFLAFHDPLTRLPNRLLVRDRQEQAIAYAGRSGARVATMFLDLDNFKTINDSLGHPAGDALLRAVADRLRGCIRECDTIGRQGGDEFLITVTDLADVGDASAIAEKLLDALSQSFCIEGHELATSASIGISIFPDDGSDFDTLLKMADMAMYQAKAAGRNAYRFFTEQMNADASDHLVMRSGLRRALDRGEFVLYYQPQVDLASGRTIGLEALIRWNHPELGLVLPGRFIGVAEDSGLIVPMGDWVIGEACSQAAALAAEGFAGVSIAVNLSAVQFKRGNLEATIVNAIRAAGITPDCLELELTESMLIKDTESALAMVQRLKALGVKLSIDDFGTGYSSLSYLKRFNVDKLKIDQSFVRDLARDPDDAAIVRAIIQLARSLDLKTIAEGVEDATMLETLRTYGCDEVQGYHFARPMPAADLPAFLGR